MLSEKGFSVHNINDQLSLRVYSIFLLAIINKTNYISKYKRITDQQKC